MSPSRLSALDAAFLAIESEDAPMHVGWAALFRPPAGGPAPTFDAILSMITANSNRPRNDHSKLISGSRLSLYGRVVCHDIERSLRGVECDQSECRVPFLSGLFAHVRPGGNSLRSRNGITKVR